jgi:two-component system, chemotaxis family, chemotaxis protein CheY
MAKYLLIDDDPVTRALLKRVLGPSAQPDFVEASDGAEGWQKLEEGQPPDLCLLDIMMPGMNGIEFLRRLRSDPRYRQMRVVMCTIVRDRRHVEAAVNLDIQGYLLKPFSVQSVRDTVERALRERMDDTSPIVSLPA